MDPVSAQISVNTNSTVSTIVERLEATGKFDISIDIDSIRNRVALTMEIDGED